MGYAYRRRVDASGPLTLVVWWNSRTGFSSRVMQVLSPRRKQRERVFWELLLTYGCFRATHCLSHHRGVQQSDAINPSPTAPTTTRNGCWGCGGGFMTPVVPPHSSANGMQDPIASARRRSSRVSLVDPERGPLFRRLIGLGLEKRLCRQRATRDRSGKRSRPRGPAAMTETEGGTLGSRFESLDRVDGQLKGR